MNLVACLLPLFVFSCPSLANTEKIIFTAPPTEALSELYDIKDEAFKTITHANSSLRTSLPVAFPNVDRPQGLDSWYWLKDLEEDKRYEVRVCWAATQPTSFTLEVYASGHGAGSILIIQSAADFFSTNATLMQHPPPVDVDIILDPYIANVFPQSLVTTAVYISGLALIAFLVSSRLWKTIIPSSDVVEKPHAD